VAAWLAFFSRVSMVIVMSSSWRRGMPALRAMGP
jgi:hypothetical protein